MVRIGQPRNQVLFGGPGTGKSLMLKRLAYSAVRKDPNIPIPRPVFGIYINCLRELGLLNSVCDNAQIEGVRSSIPDVDERLDAFANHYVCLTMAWAVCKELAESESSIDPAGAWAKSVASRLRQLFGLKTQKSGSLTDLLDAVSKRRASFRLRVANQTMFDGDLVGDCTFRDIAVFVDELGRIVVEELSALHARDWYGYILLDQYDSLSTSMQVRLNLLLRRGRESFVKVAVRPYALYSLKCADGGELTPGDDFDSIYVEYPPDEEGDYEKLLDKITSKMMKSSEGVSQLLSGGISESGIAQGRGFGFPILCRLSCGLVRNFLELCGLAVNAAQAERRDWATDGFRQSDLAAATMILARRELERLGSVKGMAGQPVRLLVDGLCRRFKRRGTPGTNLEVSIRSGTLFEPAFSSELDRVLRKAFECGGIKFASAQDASLFTLPLRFFVNPILFVRHEMPLD